MQLCASDTDPKECDWSAWKHYIFRLLLQRLVALLKSGIVTCSFHNNYTELLGQPLLFLDDTPFLEPLCTAGESLGEKEWTGQMSEEQAVPPVAAQWQTLTCWNQVVQAMFVWSRGLPCRRSTCLLTLVQRHSCGSMCLKGDVSWQHRYTSPHVSMLMLTRVWATSIGYSIGLALPRAAVTSLITPETKLVGCHKSSRFHCRIFRLSDSLVCLFFKFKHKIMLFVKKIRHCQERS